MKNMNRLLVLFLFLILGFFSIFIFIFKGKSLRLFGLKPCSELNGKVCINNASQTCANAQWVDASDTDFCCVSQCISNPICLPDQHGGSTCACGINPKKDAIGIVIKRNGELDTPPVVRAIKNYLRDATSHTKKKSIGLKRFTGNTKEDLADFIKNLYQKEGLGSLILVGRDLPIFDDLGSAVVLSDEFVTNLSFIDRSVSMAVGSSTDCKDISISYVIPRYYESKGYSAVEFVKNTFQNFADYHADRDRKRSLFKKEALVLRWDNTIDDTCGWDLSFSSQQSVLPETKILNTQHKTLKSMLNQKFAFLDIDTHGSELTQGLGLTEYPDGDKNCSSIYISIADLERYAQNNQEQFLIVAISTCGNITVGSQMSTNCCFPQKYLEIGVWCYPFLMGSEHDIRKVSNYALSGETLSDGIKKGFALPVIFGDILCGL